METKNGSRKGAMAFSFTAGSLLGALAALLLAPWEGRQTRGKLKELGEEVKAKSIQLSNDLKEKTAVFLEKRKNMIPERENTVSPYQVPGQDEAGMEKEISTATESA